jgi:Carbohydrate binding domain/Tetratricopeptide repeat
MRIALDSRLRKGAFLAGCTLPLFCVLVLSTQTFLEYWITRSPTFESLKRAARIQPLNSLHQEVLGALAMDPAVGDFQGAAGHLQAAVALNPHSSRAWLNLANVYEVLGDRERSARAILRALAVEPKETQVQWEAANLIIGSDLNRGLQLLQGVIESNPQYTSAAMQVAFRASDNNVDKAIQAIPTTASARFAAMRWLLEHSHPDAADRVWGTIATSSDPWRPQDVFFYFDSLILQTKVKQAQAVWLKIEEKDATTRGHTSVDQLLVNGDFENTLLNGGFGWRYLPTTGVSAALDTSSFHEGNRSLALQVDVDGLHNCGIYEYVAVQPQRKYQFSGWLHAEELLSAHGLRFAVLDAYTDRELLVTDEALGSFPWRQLTGEFTSPPETELVKVALVRSPSSGLIRGRLWIDDLRMEKK